MFAKPDEISWQYRHYSRRFDAHAVQSPASSLAFLGNNVIRLEQFHLVRRDWGAGDILDELTDQGDSTQLKSRIDAILSRVSCHGSIRSGRRMQADEMNALLREMEATPMSGQCNHGRPTYVELKLSDIERLFGRT